MSLISKEELSNAVRRIAGYEKTRPDLVSLALLAAPARRVEPELLRALRLKLASHFAPGERPTVGTEAALWFSSLVESRGLDSLTMLPGVVQLLRERLRERVELLEAAHAVIENCHRLIPPIINWEEKMIYLSLNPVFEEGRRFALMNQAALSVRKALQSRRGQGLEERINELSRRLPASAVRHPGFRHLLNESQEQIRQTKNFSPASASDGGEVRSLPTRTIRIKRGIGQLLVGEITGAADFQIKVPDIRPLTIHAAQTLDATDAESFLIPDGGTISIPAPHRQIYLHTLDGNRYEVEFPAPAATPESDFEYDVFVSYSSSDRYVVEELAMRLKNDGVRVWLDNWEVEAGKIFATAIADGIEQSRIVLLCWSTNLAASPQHYKELDEHLLNSRTKTRHFIIPLRLDDQELPASLEYIHSVDWRNPSDLEYRRLLKSIRSEIGDRRLEQGREITEAGLTGHDGPVLSVAVTPDGQHIVSGSWDNTIRAWNRASGRFLFALEGHQGYVTTVATDGDLIISGSWDGTIKVAQDIKPHNSTQTFTGHTGPVLSVALLSHRGWLVSGSADQTVRVWDIRSGKALRMLEGHTGSVLSVVATPDNTQLISGGEDGKVNVWETETGKLILSISGYVEAVLAVAVARDGRTLVSGSTDRTVRTWDLFTGSPLRVFEGHTGAVTALAVTPDGRHIVSGSADGMIRAWDVDTGNCVQTLDGQNSSVLAVALTPDGRQIISGASDGIVRLAEFVARETVAESDEIGVYASAKVLLLGDTGVGKSALALRLSGESFAPTESTHGFNVYRLMQSPSEAGDAREIWLWDLAVQADYRVINQLFMNDVSLALIVTDAGSENSLQVSSYWGDALERASGSRIKKFLVTARADRGMLFNNHDETQEVVQDRAYDGFFPTSAKTGEGCDELREAIFEGIAWDNVPWRVRSHIPFVLREEILRLKEEGTVLLGMIELKRQLDLRLDAKLFTLEQLRTVVGSLATQGLVWHAKFGDQLLLQPELLTLYASAIIQAARWDDDEIGSVLEAELVGGELPSQSSSRLSKGDEEIIVRAICAVFIEQGVCFREQTLQGVVFVFPAYFKREWPETGRKYQPRVVYRFNGVPDDIYATLVVKLKYSKIFPIPSLRRDAVEFKTPQGEIYGFEMRRMSEDEAELSIFFADSLRGDTKNILIGLISEHLSKRANNVRTIHPTAS